MPTRAPHPCAHPGCPTLVRIGSRCPDHKRARHTFQDNRGSSSSRGYDRKWERVRRLHLRREPWCRVCKAEGRLTTHKLDVDHIVPFTDKHDPLRLDLDNLQTLCRPHHNAKTNGRGHPGASGDPVGGAQSWAQGAGDRAGVSGFACAFQSLRNLRVC